MLPFLLLPVVLQGLAMFVDELVFHRRRGLPRWERLGHPLDTLTVALCYGWLLAVPPNQPHALPTYVGLCAFSCLFITKDEFVHAKVCEPAEAWLHSVLFVLHPIVFLTLALVWRSQTEAWLLKGVFASTLALLAYQLLYWNLQKAPHTGAAPARFEDAE